MLGRGLFGYDDLRWLKSKKKPQTRYNQNLSPIRTVDLFAGCGGLSLGIAEYCRRTKRKHIVEFASEWNKKILEIFKANLQPKKSSSKDIEKLISGSIRTPFVTKEEKIFLSGFPEIMNPDLLTGGPPCQDNSDLNNHTRRDGVRNDLYFRMVRAAFLLKPKAVIIENVPEVIHSEQDVVNKAMRKLDKIGYDVVPLELHAVRYGVPQYRVRHFLVGTCRKQCNPIDKNLLESISSDSERTVKWAIEDLLGKATKNKEDFMNLRTDSNDVNQERMDWLIDNDEYNLPNQRRCPSHQDGNTYPAVYGRMYWDKPADTITTGFTSNGQGRFTHPLASPGRPLTPHEAARLQTFPDWFNFEAAEKRGNLKTAIGNAVPPLLAMCIAHVVVSSFKI